VTSIHSVQVGRVDEQGVLGRFRARTRKSSELFHNASSVSPGGVMAGIKFFEPYPIFMKRAEGSHIWDVDGNEYVDYLMSYGALILGHGHSVLRSSVDSVLDTVGTTVMGTPTELEARFGGTLRDMYHKDGMMRFTNSGLEATLLAVRLARAFTGKRNVAKFEGHYHGAVDRLLFSYAPDPRSTGPRESPVPVADSADVSEGILSESLVLPFNDWVGTEALLTGHAKELACVIMEPFEEGVIAGERRFMEELRKLTLDLRIPLIYDEVKTAFRVRPGGASEYYGITPDVTCLGKIIGGGLPIGALVGETQMMELLDPRQPRSKRVFHSGTFNGNPLSLAVGEATVEEIISAGKFDSLVSTTETLKRSVATALKKRGISHTIAGEGAMFNIYLREEPVRNYREAMASDLRLRKFLDLELVNIGVYLKPQNRFCTSTAHALDDVKQTGAKFAEALDAVLPTDAS
jgi:glutamate-1-semialdehyde 2,1-aminomutase